MNPRVIDIAKMEALAVFRKNLPNISEDLANKSYEIMLHPTKGFTRRAELDVEGVKTVLELRIEYAEPRSRWASRSNITICNTTTKRVRGDGAAFVPGANAISYVPRVDWDGMDSASR